MENNLNISLDFIKQMKQEILRSRYIVAKIANAESLKLYFNIGKVLDAEANKLNWGSKVIELLSERLQQELPGLRGFSASNLKKMRIFYSAWCNSNLISSLATNQIEGVLIHGHIESLYS